MVSTRNTLSRQQHFSSPSPRKTQGAFRLPDAVRVPPLLSLRYESICDWGLTKHCLQQEIIILQSWDKSNRGDQKRDLKCAESRNVVLMEWTGGQLIIGNKGSSQDRLGSFNGVEEQDKS